MNTFWLRETRRQETTKWIRPVLQHPVRSNCHGPGANRLHVAWRNTRRHLISRTVCYALSASFNRASSPARPERSGGGTGELLASLATRKIAKDNFSAPFATVGEKFLGVNSVRGSICLSRENVEAISESLALLLLLPPPPTKVCLFTLTRSSSSRC